MSSRNDPVEIAPSVWWVGAHTISNQLHCNPYLIVDNDCAVLIDPGSVLDFNQVFDNIARIIDPKAISHFVLHHQDPDLCSAVPVFEEKGIVRPVVTHWRSSVISHYYGIKGPFYLVDREDYRLQLPSGRTLQFLHTPYLHFPGAIVTYDQATEVLFSSDLFGAFYIDEGLQELFAGPGYIEAMKAFHEHYMPGNDHLRPIMETFLNMSISLIAPQHGSIIRKDDVAESIRTLRDLECGAFLNPIKKKLARENGYVGVANEVLRRCHGIAGIQKTLSIFNDTEIVLDPVSGFIDDFSTTGEELWNNLFRIIENREGIGWLTALEVLVRKLTIEYSIPMPDVYASSLADIARKAESADKQYREQKALSERLHQNIEETREQLTLDPVSGLYNADFFMQYLRNELPGTAGNMGAFMLISIDDLQRINFRYGSVQGDGIVRICGMLIKELLEETMMLARLEGAMFGVYLPGFTMDTAETWAEKLRVKIAESTAFIEPLTVSIGLVHTKQTPDTVGSTAELIQFLYAAAGVRVRVAKKRGANYVCKESSDNSYSESTGKVLLVDTETVSVDILMTMFQQMEIDVACAADGDTAIEKIDTFNPDIVISEVMVPKVDGFGIRERMVQSSSQKRKTFIVLSHIKNEEMVQRAQSLGIIHYFKKPYLLSEITGLVKNLLRSSGET